MTEERGTFTKERRFPPLRDWPHFLERWEAVDTEEEAIGLLYAGASIGTNFLLSPEMQHHAAGERVDFYLHWAEHDERRIRLTAQQVIVKGLLKGGAIPVRADTVPAHRALLGFLREPRSALRLPPYPRFAANYILGILNFWEKPRTASDAEVHAALRVLPADEVLWPVMSWGHGWTLALHGERAGDITPVIERFLLHHCYDWETFFRRGRDSSDIIEDLSQPEVHLRLCDRAAWSLLKLRFNGFGGVSVKTGEQCVTAPA